MDIGKETEVIEVEEIETAFPKEQPVPTPAPEKAPAKEPVKTPEKVPAGR